MAYHFNEKFNEEEAREGPAFSGLLTALGNLMQATGHRGPSGMENIDLDDGATYSTVLIFRGDDPYRVMTFDVNTVTGAVSNLTIEGVNVSPHQNQVRVVTNILGSMVTND